MADARALQLAMQSPVVDETAELQTLACLLTWNDLYLDLAPVLRPEMFSVELYAEIWRTACALLDRGENAHVVSVARTWNVARGDAAGAREWLARVAGAIVPKAGAIELARIVRDNWLRREAQQLAATLSADAGFVDASEPFDACLDRVEQGLLALRGHGTTTIAHRMAAQAVREGLAAIDAAREHGGVSGLATGLRALDENLGGLHRGEMTIAAARPGMGKTAFALTVAANVALSGAPVAFLSLEESVEMLTRRLLSRFSGVPLTRLRYARLDAHDRLALDDAAKSVGNMPLMFDATPSRTIPDIRATLRRLRHEMGGKLALAVIDHVGLIPPTRPNASQYERVTEASEGLKVIAKQLDVPVLALNQLSRAVEQRDDKRPQLADLRDSGRLEEDARVVLFLYREAYYRKRAEPQRREGEHDGSFASRIAAWQADYETIKHEADVIVAKQNNGPTGTVRLRFHEMTTTFSDERGTA